MPKLKESFLMEKKQEKAKRPFVKNDFEAVLKDATQPLKKATLIESEGTSAHPHSGDSNGSRKR